MGKKFLALSGFILTLSLGAQAVETATAPAYQPVPDTANFKYVLLSYSSSGGQISNLRYTIAQNLPAGVKLVLLIRPGDSERVRREYSNYMDTSRLILAEAPDSYSVSGGFWARDSFPVPVVNRRGGLELVAAQYFRPFYGHSAIANALGITLHQFDFQFVGGNLLADEKGVCFTVKGPRSFNLRAQDLKNAYGCKDVHEMPYVAGIGDVDEVLKPIGNGVVLTNQESYVADLTRWGYRVVRLPLAGHYKYRTYANSLIVGKTVFMPTYNMETDAAATAVYEGQGYKVVGVRSIDFSDNYMGSIHCQTMAYPAMPENALLETLQLRRID